MSGALSRGQFVLDESRVLCPAMYKCASQSAQQNTKKHAYTLSRYVFMLRYSEIDAASLDMSITKNTHKESSKVS